MKNKIALTALIIIALFMFAGCSLNPNESTPERITIDVADGTDKANKLVVSATGSVDVMPDVAYVTVGVVTQNKDVKTAQSDNTKLMIDIFDALKEKGLTEDDMRTTQYNVYPIHRKGEISKYEVTNMVKLTIKDIDSVGEYIDIAAENGANTSYPVSFSLLDKDAFYNDALTDAVQKAKGKANTIASAGGYSIIGTLEITESSYGYTPYNEYAMDNIRAEDASGGTTPITAGELTVTANISVVYEIE